MIHHTIRGKIRTALCISGQVRNYEGCFKNLTQHILKPLNPDVFIHTWSNRGCSAIVTKRTPESLARKMKKWEKYNDQEITTEDLSIYSPRKIIIEDFRDEYKSSIEDKSIPNWILDHYQGRLTGKVADGQKWPTCHIHSYLPMFYKIEKANDLKKEAESEDGQEYDLVIRFRLDQTIGAIPEICLQNLSTLWCNENKGSPFLPETNRMQVSDRFALSSSKIMDIYCSTFSNINKYWEDKVKQNPTFNSWEFPVGDRLLRRHLVAHGVEHNSFGPFAPIYRPD